MTEPTMPPELADRAPLFVVEAERRLSESVLWRAQRAFFHQRGVNAWSSATVPHYITGNALLAHAYAATILGFLRDCLAGDEAAGASADEPFTLLELGAGSGRFAYLLVRALLDLLDRSSLAGTKIRYVLSDFTESNVAFFGAHPALQSFVERGILDFAVFDAESDTEVRLEHGNVRLGPGALTRPLVVIANYVFDGIPQDAFLVRAGALHESLLSVASPTPGFDPTAPVSFDRLALDFRHRPVSRGYYPEPELDEALFGHLETAGEGSLLFPCAALRCLRRLADLAGGRLFLLSGDRDDGEGALHPSPGAIGWGFHGSFSLPVDHDAIHRYVAGAGGRSLRMSHRHAGLDVAGFLLGEHRAGYPETHLAYREAVDRAGPDDFFSLRRGLQGGHEGLEIEHLLALIRLSRDDARILSDCLPALTSRLGNASPAAKDGVIRTALRAEANYYPIGEAHDFPFGLGLLFYTAGAPALALARFQRSLMDHGEDARTRWNMGLCYARMGRIEEAAKCFASASAVEPAFCPTGALQEKG
jgi:tetratricopeptide (TPR) repeat protein